MFSLEEMLRFLTDRGARETPHSGASFLDHLRATHDLLSSWGVPDFVSRAGLFHSVYGTAGDAPALDITRDEVQQILGRDAERLVYLYSRLERDFELESEAVAEEDAKWLAHLIMANAVEQSHRGWPSAAITLPQIVRRLLPAVKAHLGCMFPGAPSPFTNAAAVLSWNEPGELVADVVRFHRDSSGDAVTARVAQLAGEYPHLLDGWQRLLPAHRTEIATSPALWLRMESDDASAAQFLSELIAGPLRPVAHFGGIVVDFFGPHSGGNPDVPPEGDRDHSSEEARVVLQRIESALRLIYETSWEAATFVDQVLVMIAPRHDAVTPHVAWSGSWPSMIGKAVLANAHLDSATPFFLADAILHEAVHSFLYRLERIVPIFHEMPDHGVTVRSPWTESELAPSSFSHACLVWFALWTFWDRARRRDSAPRGDVDFFLKRATRGFLGAPLGDNPAGRAWIPDFAAAVETCQRRVAEERR